MFRKSSCGELISALTAATASEHPSSRLAHRGDLRTEGADELLHRALCLNEGAGDLPLRRGEVGAELQRLAVPGAPPGVDHFNGLLGAHICMEAGPKNGLRSCHRRRSPLCQSSCRTAGRVHSESRATRGASLGG